MKQKVAVFFGGKSPEHDISIITGLQAMSKLRADKYEIFPIYIKDGYYFGKFKSIDDFVEFDKSKCEEVVLIKGSFFTVKKKLKRLFKPDVALLCTHGGNGENGVLQGILEDNQIPYTSSNVFGSAIGMDKEFSKQLFESDLINVVRHFTVEKDDFEKNQNEVIMHLETFLSYPMITKPVSLGSSIGIKKSRNREELVESIHIATFFDTRVIVENALERFTEVNCAAVSDGEKVYISETESPTSWNEFLTFEDKYANDGKMSEIDRKIPAELDPSMELEVKDITEKIYTDFGLKGVVRFDFLVEEKNKKLYLNEINTIPGSLAFYLFEPIGISFEELLDIMVKGAVYEYEKVKKCSFVFQSNVLKNFKGGTKK